MFCFNRRLKSSLQGNLLHIWANPEEMEGIVYQPTRPWINPLRIVQKINNNLHVFHFLVTVRIRWCGTTAQHNYTLQAITWLQLYLLQKKNKLNCRHCTPCIHLNKTAYISYSAYPAYVYVLTFASVRDRGEKNKWESKRSYQGCAGPSEPFWEHVRKWKKECWVLWWSLSSHRPHTNNWLT